VLLRQRDKAGHGRAQAVARRCARRAAQLGHEARQRLRQALALRVHALAARAVRVKPSQGPAARPPPVRSRAANTPHRHMLAETWDDSSRRGLA